MASLKEVRNRITSVSSTQQITKAMKMVSAAKLRRAQNRVTQMRPYSQKLDEMLQNVSNVSEEVKSDYARVRPVEKVLIVAITSDKGLCGPFNNNINKEFTRMIANLAKSYPVAQVEGMAIGKKGRDFFKKTGVKYHEENVGLFDILSFDEVGKAADDLMKRFMDKEFDEIHVIYNEFKNAATQIIRNEQFLPIIPSTDGTLGNSQIDYIFEPSIDYILQELIPNSLRTRLYKGVLDSNAAEHGARMTAMTQATDNAGELLKDLKLTYNRTRQAAITKEILEIVGGAEALGQSS